MFVNNLDEQREVQVDASENKACRKKGVRTGDVV